MRVCEHTHTQSRVCVCTNGFGRKSSLCVFETMCLATLTQHNEVDLAPVVLSSRFDFAVVFPRVSQQQVADQQGGVSIQVLPSKGQTVGLATRCLIGVHLASKEGNDLHMLKTRKAEIYFSTVYTKPSCLRCHTPLITELRAIGQITTPLYLPSSF